MRVVLGAKDTDKRWLPSELSASDTNVVVNALKRQLVLSTNDSHYRQLLSEIREIQVAPQVRSRLGDLLQRVPFIARETKPPIDLYVEDFASGADSKLLPALNSPDFVNLLEQRAGSVLKGERREDIFEQRFLYCAAAATGFWGLDKFLFTHLDNGRAGGLTWFLQKCINLGASEFVLFSALPPSQDLTKCKQILLSRLDRPIWMRQQKQPITVKLVAAHHKLGPKSEGGDGAWLHERHVRFRIGTDAQRVTPAFDIGPGFAVFDYDEMRDHINLTEELDRKAVREREKEVVDLADRPFETLTLG
jgi:hypothetical protein